MLCHTRFLATIEVVRTTVLIEVGPSSGREVGVVRLRVDACVAVNPPH